ncbi:waprin-Phi1-like [Chelonus insularis]|uniref:waprin-Phi1-like n=1 Tax=Chelonus insularis TaxID=460826 RepID=UPI00158C5987|nr:waprin-Phi1-like [Chelonus insularis]
MLQIIAKILIISLIATQSYSQFVKLTYFEEKPGSCPPPLSTKICSQACFVDEHCQGMEKCCPTICGGSTCSKPAIRDESLSGKSGSCPRNPVGRRPCSSTCTTDSDCQGSKVCCKNRCGALTCQLPYVEPKETNVSPKNHIESHINQSDTTTKPNNISPGTHKFNPNNPFLFPRN